MARNTSDSACTRSILTRARLALCALLALGLASSSTADVPFEVGYQGAVFDSEGAPAAGPVDVEVEIYTAATDGSLLYGEQHDAVALVSGAFDLRIGAGSSRVGTFDPDTLAGPAWLELTVDGERLDPRQRLVAVPYAMRAAVAERIEGELGTVDVHVAGAGSQLEGAALRVENTNPSDGVAAHFTSQSAWETARFENSADGEVVKIYGIGVGVEDAALRVENLSSGDAFAGWFRGRTRFENQRTGGEADGRRRAVEIIGNGSWSANPALFVENKSTNHGIAGRFMNNSTYPTGQFWNAGSGVGVYASGYGATASQATFYGINQNTTNGVTGYLENQSPIANTVLRNRGTGQVLYLHNNAASREDFGTGSSAFIVGVAGDDHGNPRFWIDASGMAHVRALEIRGGADFSELFDVSGDASGGEAPAVEPGTVVSIDADHPGRLRVSERPYDTRVAGVVAGAGGVEPGMLLAQQGNPLASGDHPVALSGRVYAKADTSGGPIRPGDLLTTSGRPGHAMRVEDRERAGGSILGKAMTGLDEQTGLVLVLVNLQ